MYIEHNELLEYSRYSWSKLNTDVWLLMAYKMVKALDYITGSVVNYGTCISNTSVLEIVP